MSTLSKQTKAQLSEIAEAIGLDTAGLRVKKDFYDAVKDYFLETELAPSDPYYELARASRLLGKGKPTVIIAEEEEEDDDDEDDDSEGSTEQEDDEDDESESTFAKIKNALLLKKQEHAVAKKKRKAKFILFVILDAFVHYEKVKLFKKFVAKKSDQLREYLSDPYTINQLFFVFETLLLLSKYNSKIPLGDALHASDAVKDKLPEWFTSAPVTDLSVLNQKDFWAVVGLWSFVAYFVPTFVSYFVNFTYDFKYDCFTYALTKLFIAVILFNESSSWAQWTHADILLADSTCEAFQNALRTSARVLQATYGNLVVFDSIFAALISLYANLAYV